MRRALIVPAAGTGSRLGSPLPKVLHPVAGRPMLAHLASLYRPWIDRWHLVARPQDREAIAAACAGLELPAGDGVQHLGERRAQARAGAGGGNDQNAPHLPRDPRHACQRAARRGRPTTSGSAFRRRVHERTRSLIVSHSPPSPSATVVRRACVAGRP